MGNVNGRVKPALGGCCRCCAKNSVRILREVVGWKGSPSGVVEKEYPARRKGRESNRKEE